VSAAFNISLYATAGDRSFTLKIGNVVRGGESEAGPYAARAADPCKKAKAPLPARTAISKTAGMTIRKLSIQTAVKIEPQYGPATIDA
jgi:hypothetical protein